MSPSLPYRIGVQQRVFPAYRAPFFDALARTCTGGLSLFAGEPQAVEALGQAGTLTSAQHVLAENIYLGRGRFLLYWQVGLLDWLEHLQPDALIVEANPRNLSNNAAIRWMHARKMAGRTQRRPVIGWALGAPPGSGRLASLLRMARRGYLRQFDALISYSETGKRQFILAGAQAGKVFVAPNAAASRPVQQPPARPPEYSQGRPVVLFVGRLQARKRVEALLRACACLPENLQPRLVIVGDGPAREDFMAAARAMYPAAEFVGEKTGPDLLPYFNAADLFVLPGTGGLAVQQAMSAGLPVMVAEADGTQSELVRPENGWLLPSNDDQALCAVLNQALSDPARLRRMGAESYRIAAEEVNLERMVTIFSDVIQRVCGSPI